MNLKAERGAATRDRVLAIATRLFAEHGYDGTSIEMVLHESALSRGALYHHYAGKDALFEAVLEAVEERVGREIAEAVTRADGAAGAATGTAGAVGAGAGGAAEALRLGVLAWVRLAGDPVIQRIVLIDAPSVLGWEKWREVEARHAFGMLKGALRATGAVPGDHLDLYAHMLLAAVNEMALLVARTGKTEEAERAVEDFLARLLAGPAPT
ncbi:MULTISPECIES: TetR/AcrR family transcriptional regulator [Nonomuraea]|uniref:TetR/AcrR family transcriptional regulator n=1 Tax=Nonomuraea mangrovi TaxID=2316207 RepID=A0ABW4SKC9_9ACTN